MITLISMACKSGPEENRTLQTETLQMFLASLGTCEPKCNHLQSNQLFDDYCTKQFKLFYGNLRLFNDLTFNHLTYDSETSRFSFYYFICKFQIDHKWDLA